MKNFFKLIVFLGVMFMIVDSKAKEFRIGLSGVAANFDSHLFNSAGEHIIMEHLLLPLVSYMDDGHLRGMAAARWEISPDYRIYTFTLKDGLKFSNGEAIRALDVKRSWERPLQNPESLHYDFKNFKSIEVLGDLKFQVTLNEADYFFLYKLLHPEFGILYSKDALAKQGQQLFEVTSGHYSIVAKTPTTVTLGRNSNLSGNQLSFERIIFENIEDAPLEKLLDGKYDLVWNPLRKTSVDLGEVKKLGYEIKAPRLNFSFWLSLNPNLAETRELKVRREIQKVLSSPGLAQENAPVLTSARQLYFDNGPGRLSVPEVNHIEKEIKNNQASLKGLKLRLLAAKSFLFAEAMAKRLEAQGAVVEIFRYANFAEYRDLIKTQDYHLVQVNNDFCLPDVSTALEVTFNESRPLIFTSAGERTLVDAVKKLSQVKTMSERNEIAYQVGKEVLSQALIVPLYYYHTLIFHKNDLNLDDWSEVYPDVSAWKIKSNRI